MFFNFISWEARRINYHKKTPFVDGQDQPILLDFYYKDVFDMNTLVPLQMLFFPFQVNSHNNAYTGNPMILKNILHNIPDSLPGELCEVIQTGNGVKIERIVSKGHASPKGFWYDQESHEWVLLLKGRATLLFEGKQNPIVLGPGDYLNIPAHTRHRVEWTDLNQETVWLAIYYYPDMKMKVKRDEFFAGSGGFGVGPS